MTDAPKAILITGCSSGIGHCAAHGLKARGYRVFATARRPEDVERLRAEGLESLPLDLDDSASIEAALEQVLERTAGRLYGLFNNGGYGQPGAVEDLSRDALRAQFETNVFGSIELTNRVIPVMRAQGAGRIIQNSSLLGLVALPYRGAYNASKYALEGFYDTLRLELHGSGVQVALLEPGPISSRFRANAHAMYRRHIDADGSVHRDTYRAMERRLTRPGPAAPFTLGPEAVLTKLLHALESPRARPRYPVTLPTWLFAGARRVLPVRALDWVLRRISRGENR
ncbi:MAG: SDR family NAD(P)-dependent oxidoreductase [Gammaproteobacteria bacterium]|nr:SDR family NAD(P)-dependent oxidoreductase [Gammaproteobacteria bacterium]